MNELIIYLAGSNQLYVDGSTPLPCSVVRYPVRVSMTRENKEVWIGLNVHASCKCEQGLVQLREAEHDT
jgi:hypothetical protein